VTLARAVVLGGLIAGVLDIVYAFVLAWIAGGSALRVLQSVASGVLGANAYEGGVSSAAFGLALHLTITVVAAWIYALAARRIAPMRRHPAIHGAMFGMLVYLFMNFVVLPLSAVPFQLRYGPVTILQGLVSHALLVGVPIAWCLRRFVWRDLGTATDAR
jgi:hypothetical protein